MIVRTHGALTLCCQPIEIRDESNQIRIGICFSSEFLPFLQKCNNNANQLKKLHGHITSPSSHTFLSVLLCHSHSFHAMKQSPQSSRNIDRVFQNKSNGNANSSFHHYMWPVLNSHQFRDGRSYWALVTINTSILLERQQTAEHCKFSIINIENWKSPCGCENYSIVCHSNWIARICIPIYRLFDVYEYIRRSA